MAESRKRMLWHELPEAVRGRVERIGGGRVVAARNQLGGFSPGLASRLRLDTGARIFAKVINGEWPTEMAFHRDEARVSRALAPSVPAPRLRGWFDTGDWVGLVFDDIEGREPSQPWCEADLSRVLAALAELARSASPPPGLSSDHPRLGGWSDIADDDHLVRRLTAMAPWAATNLATLIDLENHGLAVARGHGLVHFDLYPHNIMLSADRVYFVDWPHARVGNSLIDLVTVCSTAIPSGIDPDPLMACHPLMVGIGPDSLSGLIAAHAGFCLAGALHVVPGRHAVSDAKRALGEAALTWLIGRLTGGRAVDVTTG